MTCTPSVRFECITIPTAQCSSMDGKSPEQIAAHCLLLPGNHLDNMSTLLDKKFRSYKNREGALAGFSVLQKDGLGNLENTGKRGVQTVDALTAEIIDFETHTVVNRFARKRYQKP